MMPREGGAGRQTKTQSRGSENLGTEVGKSERGGRGLLSDRDRWARCGHA